MRLCACGQPASRRWGGDWCCGGCIARDARRYQQEKAPRTRIERAARFPSMLMASQEHPDPYVMGRL